jgi:uncharacterized membrane protein (DUF4010 family)
VTRKTKKSVKSHQTLFRVGAQCCLYELLLGAKLSLCSKAALSLVSRTSGLATTSTHRLQMLENAIKEFCGGS